MKVLFIHRKEESLGVEYLSAVLKEAGHKTDLLFEPCLFGDLLFVNRIVQRTSIERRIGHLVGKASPDLIAFSVNTLDYGWSCRIAREVKEHTDVPVVFGGIHPTLVPEEVIKNGFVDFVVVGEGEYAFRELVDSLESGKKEHRIKNVWYKKDGKIVENPLRPLVADLDELPFPDKDLFYRKFPGFRIIYSLMSSRGCPFDCTYCCNHVVKRLYKNDRNFVRRRSVDNVIEELEAAKRKYGQLSMVSFDDDNLLLDEGWLEEFSGKYRDRIGIPYECLVHPVSVNGRVAKLLADSGCNFIEMGVQSFNEELRRRVLNRHHTNEQVERALDILGGAGIFVGVDYIVGIPGESIEDVLAFARLLNNHRLALPQMYKLAYFPKTEITRMFFEGKADGCPGGRKHGGRPGIDDAGTQDRLTELSGRFVIDSRYIETGEYSSDTVKLCFYLNALFPMLPRRINGMILDKKLYRLTPNVKYLLDFSSALLSPIAVKIMLLMNHKKYEWSYNYLRRRLNMYLYFMLRKQQAFFEGDEKTRDTDAPQKKRIYYGQ